MVWGTHGLLYGGGFCPIYLRRCCAQLGNVAPRAATQLPCSFSLQISSKEEPRHYSAKIAWNARNNSHMPLLATGAPAINCAVKVGAAGLTSVCRVVE